MNWLHKIIDESLSVMAKTDISMMTPGEVPKEMQDGSNKNDDGWRRWKPIDSIIEDSDIEKVEKEIGYPLPQSYREYLKYKHFIELRIPDRAVNLPGILPDKEINFLKELVFEMMEPELIIGRGYIYFADFNDYGLLCFDANEKVQNNEYRIVFIDHEDEEAVHLYANNFKELMEADEEYGNRFIDYLNDYYN
ncbi:MAG: SMI1/KNR4 family protein [Crocinitomicaceae bacterium]|nr:SMI1/KNR4 family protein [Crocinitomicaceae bacterium]